jgi:hypothetical protein
MKQNLKIFFTSFFQIGLVCMNTVLIAKGIVLGIFLASFTISLLWCYNVSRVSISGINEKLTYSLGAGIGAITGYYLITFFL